MSDLVMRGTPAIQPEVPYHLQQKLLWLSDEARSMSVHMLAGKGSGKSRMIGRVITWLDFVRGVPLVLMDPNGPSIDNFLDKLTRLPREYQEQLWKRVLYVDMSGQGGRVVPFPLYYRLRQESLYAISQRYLDIIRRVDPYLVTASVQGWNALWRIGTYTGMILAALNLQITEAEALIRDPEAWRGRLSQAGASYPELTPAVSFFTEQFPQWKEAERAAKSDSFLTKISLFSLDPVMTAMFGATQPGINWAKVFQERTAVLLDFRHEHDVEQRRFKMLWAFKYLLDFIKQRGAGRHQPISLIIDELTGLTNFQGSDGASLFAQDLDELINVIARNYRVWLTISHQEMFQVDERTAKTLLAMGTQIFGSTSDMDAAITLARQFFPINPYSVKRFEPVYTSYRGETAVIDQRPVEFSIEEQHYLKAYEIKDQGALHFLVRPAAGEGDVRGRVQRISLENFDHNIWVDEALVEQARELLSHRDGLPVSQVLAEVQARLPAHKERLLTSGTATMKEYGPHTRDEDDDDVILREKK